MSDPNSITSRKNDFRIGDRFGRRTIVAGPGTVPYRGHNGVVYDARTWFTRCDCGTESWVKEKDLGRTISGGCRQCATRLDKNLCFFVGKIVGHRTIVDGPKIRMSGNVRKQALRFWLMRCRCGIEKWVMEKNLRVRKGEICTSCSRIQHTGVEIVIGKHVGMRVIVAGPKISKGKTRWLLECRCGKQTWRTQSEIAYDRVPGYCDSCGKIEARNARYKKELDGLNTAKRRMWTGVMTAAAERGLAVTVDAHDAFDLLGQQGYRCALTGLRIRLASDYKDFEARNGTASLDRIDSTQGYIPGNIQWVHKDINRLKNNFPEHELLRLCGLIVRHAKRRKAAIESHEIYPLFDDE